MIKVNGYIIELSHFGDGTLKCNEIDYTDCTLVCENTEIIWAYDNDEELFALWCIVQDIKQHRPNIHLNLIMPYIPHARQDRRVSGRIFTLKYFAQLINMMNFEKVFVLDPHSDVAPALIDRIYSHNHYPNNTSIYYMPYDKFWHTYRLWDTKIWKEKPYQIMYPDNGAAKKYNAKEDDIIGFKHRNAEGRIDSYELKGLRPQTKTVIIRDDICSYGGTFVSAAKALREQGVEKIYLIVNHCENNILKGEVFDYIDEVWTTDSICTVKHPKLCVQKIYRN